MAEIVIAALLWFAAIGCGLMAGLYFAFSTFIMSALDRLGAAAAAAAMNAINAVILRSAFVPLFFGTSVAALALIIAGLLHGSDPDVSVVVAGGMIYLVGMLGVTILFNVPLNDRLARTPSDWPAYRRAWARWNHVRTLASTLAAVLFVVALIDR